MSLGPMVKSPSRTVSPNAIPQEAISSFKAGTLAPPVTENNNIKSSLPKNTFSLIGTFKYYLFVYQESTIVEYFRQKI